MPAAQSGTASAFLARGWLWAIKPNLDDAPQVNRTLRQQVHDLIPPPPHRLDKHDLGIAAPLPFSACHRIDTA